jgi:hypothetical protein
MIFQQHLNAAIFPGMQSGNLMRLPLGYTDVLQGIMLKGTHQGAMGDTLGMRGVTIMAPQIGRTSGIATHTKGQVERHGMSFGLMG